MESSGPLFVAAADFPCTRPRNKRSGRMPRKSPARELCSIEPDGRVTDERLHADILNNPKAERLLARHAIKRAIRSGLSEDLAERLYGIHG